MTREEMLAEQERLCIAADLLSIGPAHAFSSGYREWARWVNWHNIPDKTLLVNINHISGLIAKRITAARKDAQP